MTDIVKFKMTQKQIDFLNVVRERFGNPDSITRHQMFEMVKEGLVPRIGYFMKRPDFRLSHGRYLVPTPEQCELYTPKVGRPRKETENVVETVAPVATRRTRKTMKVDVGSNSVVAGVSENQTVSMESAN